jgi:hypothetical protein
MDTEQTKLTAMAKELEMWVTMMSGNNNLLKPLIVKKTVFCINQYTLMSGHVGHIVAFDLKAWWGEKATGDELMEIMSSPMKVDGSPRNWSVGEFGSRWCDVIINRRLTRVSFQSRKFNRMPDNMPHKDYIIELDASDSCVLTDEEIKADKKKKVCAGCGYFTKTMKASCCGDRYCSDECYKENKKEHLEKCETARQYVADKKSM